MKITQIVLVAITLTTGFTSNAQEVSTERKKSTEISKATASKDVIRFVETKTPEQIATERAVELKSQVELTDDQFTAVKDLFLKMENRKAALTNVSEEEKAKEIANLKVNEDKALKAILTPAQQKIISKPNSTTKTATSM